MVFLWSDRGRSQMARDEKELVDSTSLNAFGSRGDKGVEAEHHG